MRKIKTLVLTLILMIIGVNIVKAEDYKIIVEAETGIAGSALNMKIEGIDAKEAVENNYDYYIKFQDEKPTLTGKPYDSEEGVNEGIDSYFHISINEDYDYQNIPIKDDWYLIKGYTNAYLIKCVNYNTCEVIDNKISVERPKLPALGQRYKNYLFGEAEEDAEDYGNTLSVFPYFPFDGEIGSHELNVKIGLIKDNNLLKSLSKNEAGSLDKLLEYAKNNDGKVIKNKDEEFHYVNIGDFEVINDAYYYMYTYYTNTDGLYRDLDDVTVVMGEADMLVNDVEWNLEDSEWDKFIEKFKSTEFFETVSKQEGNIINVAYTTDSLKIDSELENKKYTTNFTYTNGILEYVPSESDDNIIVDSIWVVNSLNALSNLKGYNFETLQKWYDKQENLTIEKDGIQIKTEQSTQIRESADGTVDIDISTEKIIEFKLDIINGIKTFDPNFSEVENNDEYQENEKEEIVKPSEDKKEEVKNPATGIKLEYGILAIIILLGGIAYLFIGKKSKFPKHN